MPEESGNERHGDLQDIVRAVKAKGAALWSHDWVITNPPFRLAEEFVMRAPRTLKEHRPSKDGHACLRDHQWNFLSNVDAAGPPPDRIPI